MKIIINERTPTCNNLYSTNKWGKRFMSREAKALKQRILDDSEEQLAGQNYERSEWFGRLLKIRVEIHESWWTKKQTVKKKDIANREKFLIDSVFEGLGLDDCFIWEHTLIKIDDEREFSEIDIEYYCAE